MTRGPSVAMVAGETSGDLLAGLMLQGMLTRWPSLQSAGIGGPSMVKQGFDAWWPSELLAVRGYVEVLRHYRQISLVRKQLQTRLLKQRPDMFIGIDAPDFNLNLEFALKCAGIKTVHFVCPSIWAWRPERIEKIRQSVDHLLCIFPFEESFLRQNGIAATYVGHPLAGVIPMVPDQLAARVLLGLSDHDRVVAVLPGSRKSEVQYLGSRFFEAVALMHLENPDIKFIVPVVPSLLYEIRQAVIAAGVGAYVQLVNGQSHDVLAACDVTLIASGTATLEAALFKRPMVIAYNMNWLTWQIIRRKKLQPWVGLPNILCREFVVPEFLQEQASPRALAKAVIEWFNAPEKTETLKSKFTHLHQELQLDTAQLATDAIQKILET